MNECDNISDLLHQVYDILYKKSIYTAVAFFNLIISIDDDFNSQIIDLLTQIESILNIDSEKIQYNTTGNVVNFDFNPSKSKINLVICILKKKLLSCNKLDINVIKNEFIKYIVKSRRQDYDEFEREKVCSTYNLKVAQSDVIEEELLELNTINTRTIENFISRKERINDRARLLELRFEIELFKSNTDKLFPILVVYDKYNNRIGCLSKDVESFLHQNPRSFPLFESHLKIGDDLIYLSFNTLHGFEFEIGKLEDEKFVSISDTTEQEKSPYDLCVHTYDITNKYGFTQFAINEHSMNIVLSNKETNASHFERKMEMGCCDFQFIFEDTEILEKSQYIDYGKNGERIVDAFYYEIGQNRTNLSRIFSQDSSKFKKFGFVDIPLNYYYAHIDDALTQNEYETEQGRIFKKYICSNDIDKIDEFVSQIIGSKNAIETFIQFTQHLNNTSPMIYEYIMDRYKSIINAHNDIIKHSSKSK